MDLLPLRSDPNQIIDVGDLCKIGGLISAVALCQALKIEFYLLPLDSETFLYGH